MYALPADLTSPDAGSVELGDVPAGLAADHPVTRPMRADPTQFLDVDVDQLTRAGALVAADWLGRIQAAELAETDPLQHRRDCRGGHLQELGDLGPG